MKKHIRATVTERGQVTIPAEIRKILGLKSGPIEFVIEDGIVVLQRPAYTLREVAGIIPPLNSPEDWEARIREAREDRALEIYEKMQRM